MTTHEAPLTATGPTLCCNREPAELAAGDTFSTTGGVDCPGRPAVCPECQAGKHTICIHMAMNDGAEFVDCACGCEPSRTCPSCKDTVPVGWTLDVHFNCNWPEDFEGITNGLKETDKGGERR